MDDAELTKLLCAVLGGIDGWVWSETGDGYDSAEVCVFYGRIPEKPDVAAGVRVYGGTDDRFPALSWRRAQVRLRGGRGDPAGADVLGGAVFRALQGLAGVPGISDISRTSFAPLGADTNEREERTENFIIILDNQES